MYARLVNVVKQQPHSDFTNMASANVSSFEKPNNNPQKRTHIQSSKSWWLPKSFCTEIVKLWFLDQNLPKLVLYRSIQVQNFFIICGLLTAKRIERK